jgi:SAM-dependent methyltransferase
MSCHRPSRPRRSRIGTATLGALLLSAATGASPAPAADTPAILDEVPFVTTPDHVTLAMLELAGVTAADRIVDLGSGDGRIVITAARRFGARGLGVEIAQPLVDQSLDAARRAGVADRAEFRRQDLFETDLAGFTVITMYLLPEVNLALRPRLAALAPGTRIVSHDWDLGDWRPDRTLTVDAPQKTVGLDKQSRLHLWTVPARLAGLWCGDPGSGAALRVEQRWQEVSMTLETAGSASGPGGAGTRDARALSGRLGGAALDAIDAGGGRWAGRLVGALLQLQGPAGGTWALRRTDGPSCNAASAARAN